MFCERHHQPKQETRNGFGNIVAICLHCEKEREIRLIKLKSKDIIDVNPINEEFDEKDEEEPENEQNPEINDDFGDEINVKKISLINLIIEKLILLIRKIKNPPTNQKE